MSSGVSDARWRWAQEGQRRAQERKRLRLAGREARLIEGCEGRSRQTHAFLAGHGVRAGADERVVEVGSGAHGLIWRWPEGECHAVDPLASFYRERFAFLQEGSVTSHDARGEELPFDDASVALLLSDNVLDHAQDPGAFLRECRRVLAHGGSLYLTVDVHHPIWDLAARLYNRVTDAGLELRVPAFPNHPFHFREEGVLALLEEAGWEIAWRSERAPSRRRPRRMRDLPKLLFFKNHRLEVIAR